MSKLEPQVGDKVTLTHEQGFVVKGRLIDRAFTGDWERWTIQNVGKFHDDDGWSVTAVERPNPEPGTFVRGVTKWGNQFGGVVYPGGVCGAFRDSLGTWVLETWKWDGLRSWEVIS